jgi:hypothetical protein
MARLVFTGRARGANLDLGRPDPEHIADAKVAVIPGIERQVFADCTRSKVYVQRRVPEVVVRLRVNADGQVRRAVVGLRRLVADEAARLKPRWSCDTITPRESVSVFGSPMQTASTRQMEFVIKPLSGFAADQHAISRGARSSLDGADE